MTKIQLALDRLTKEKCFEIVEQTEAYIDFIEVGTGVIKEYGMSIVREMSDRFPNKKIVADMKTCDAGKHEAKQAFEAGAHITTVMAFANNQTIEDMLVVANQYGQQLMVDLLGVTDSARVEELHRLGVRMFNIHIGIDLQKDVAWGAQHFQLTNHISNLQLVVSGGINRDILPLLMKQQPSVVIVGSAITGHENPALAAKEIHEGVVQL